MKRAGSLLVVLLLVGCATHQAALQPDRSPLWRAEMAFVGGTLDYEATMKSLQEYHRIKPLSAPQVRRIYELQAKLAEYAPMIRAGLDYWKSTGEKPASYDSTYAKFAAAISDVTKILSEVKR